MLPQSPADVSTGSSAEGQARLTVWMGGALCRLAQCVCVCLCARRLTHTGHDKRSETAVSSAVAELEMACSFPYGLLRKMLDGAFSVFSSP